MEWRGYARHLVHRFEACFVERSIQPRRHLPRSRSRSIDIHEIQGLVYAEWHT